MGTHFKKSIFDEHVQVGLLGWRQKAKEKGLKTALGGGSTQGGPTQGGSSGGSSITIPMIGIGRKEATTPPHDIQPANGS